MSNERRELTPEEIAAQMGYCERLRERFSDRPRLALVDTYGCQQNESDSEVLRGYLSKMGFGFTADEHEADIVILNTCAVREHAEQRVFGNVGALTHTKRENPEQLIAVCGCMAEQERIKEKLRRSYPIVDLVFGPHDLWRFPELLWERTERGRRVFAEAGSVPVVAEGLPRERDGGVKAWLTVMNGCNNFCSYCIVPYVRGRERSRRPEDVLAEARALAARGAKDITLLGQNVNSYGHDLGAETDFADLITAVDGVEGDFVLRFMTSHPKDATEKLFAAMAASRKCAHHIHLPLQSGSDRILKIMNRRYTAEKYLALAVLARSYMPDLVLTTDIIVGFPGETEEDFEDTLRLVEAVRFDAMFTFIYSPREGTPAARMPDPFTRAEKQARFDRLLDAANRISGEKHAQYVGQCLPVLIDGETGSADYNLSSRTKNGRLVHLKGDPALVGSFARAKITDSRTWALFGELQ